MAGATKWRLSAILVICLVVNLNTVMSSEEVMTKMGVTFFNVLEECKKELQVTTNINHGLVKFWSQGAAPDRELGCVFLCMAHKKDLLEEQKRLHHENAHQFAKGHGADDDKATEIVGLLHECEQQFITITDDCSRALEVARCFQAHMQRLQWAPSMEVMVEEILAGMA
uniref:Pheromone binding protein-D n=1 Tax=Ostrinia latipennis TaxID=99578 RepID=A0A2Z5V6E3_9NEOP|nr:pheromone binding protein-D [Ostrinia latipennis]